ncbi:MAG TPA: WD40 repeat domain-containing protein [Kofleriaceae bacterium]|nr:WD40 repeat domain-containing protein [Kofleriaceae bacterium]
MTRWVAYGSDEDRASQTEPVVSFAGAAFVLARSGMRGSPEHALDCIEVATGRTHRGPTVRALATAGDRAIVALAGTDEVAVLALPGLAVEARHALGAQVVAVAIDPQSPRTIVAAVAEPPSIVILDRERAPRTIELPAAPVTLALAGHRLAVATDSNTIVMIALADAAIVTILKGARTAIGGVAFAPGDRVVAAAGKTVIAWALGSKAPKATTLLKGKHELALVGVTAGGLVLAQGYKEPLTAVDPATGTVAWSIEQYGPAAVDGERVVTAQFRELRELDASTGAIRRSLAAPAHVHGAAIHGDRIVACLRGARVTVIDASATAWPVARGTGHDEHITAIAFDGERIATSGFDSRAIVWHRGAARPVLELQPPDVWYGSAIAFDGDTLLTTFERGVQRYRIAGGERLAATTSLKNDITAVLAMRELGVVIAAAEASRSSYGELYVLDVETLEVLHEERLDATYTRVRRLSDQPERVELVGGYRRLVFDVTTRTVVEDAHVSTSDYSLTPMVADDGSFVVETKNAIEVVDGPCHGWLSARTLVDDRVLYERVKTDELYTTPALSLDGRLVTAHATCLRLWDARTARELAQVELPCVPRGVAWSPDGRALTCWDDSGRMFVCDEVG